MTATNYREQERPSIRKLCKKQSDRCIDMLSSGQSFSRGLRNSQPARDLKPVAAIAMPNHGHTGITDITVCVSLFCARTYVRLSLRGIASSFRVRLAG